MEDAAGDRTRRGEEPDGEQLPQAARERGALRERIEDGPRSCVLLIRPIANALGRVRLEPAVRVDDLGAVHVVDDVLARGARCGRNRHASRLSNQTARR